MTEYESFKNRNMGNLPLIFRIQTTLTTFFFKFCCAFEHVNNENDLPRLHVGGDGENVPSV